MALSQASHPALVQEKEPTAYGLWDAGSAPVPLGAKSCGPRLTATESSLSKVSTTHSQHTRYHNEQASSHCHPRWESRKLGSVQPKAVPSRAAWRAFSIAPQRSHWLHQGSSVHLREESVVGLRMTFWCALSVYSEVNRSPS